MSLLICRSCLVSSGVLVDLQEGEYRQCFAHLAGIVVKEWDGLPQSICAECARLFSQFSLFREKIIRNHQFLVEALEQKKVTEIPDLEVSAEEKHDHIGIEIKEESLDDFPAADVLQTNDCGSENGDIDAKSKDQEKKGLESFSRRKRKEKEKSKIKSTKAANPQKPSSKIPRVVIEVDPDKITTIRLNFEEQRKRHDAEAISAAYLAMPHRCEKCYKGFNYERKLSAHVEKYHKVGAPHECPICSRTLASAASLALHAARHDTLYACRACSLTTADKKQAVAHYRAAHDGVDTRVHCAHCGESFRHRSTLNGHVRSRHPRGERPTCNQCGKSFVSKDSLLDHLLIHSGEKAHACGTCGKRFRLKAEVVVHARTHATTRPYYCQPCDKHFKTHTSYNNHRRLARPHLDPTQL